MTFSHFDIDLFLSQYWQKKPLLIRNPWKAWSNPLEPDELAGLACEEEVESRVIRQAGEALTVEQGPFAETRFGELGKAPWTLLVQAVDHYVPEVAALFEPFRFVPNWRIDDVMVSYATDGGGVGPHYDQYDVFLIQGLGRRRWRVGGLCDEDTPLMAHQDLRLLADFEASEEWVLEPGDILYVPPGIAHNGVAVGHDCMTYSVGFRAPARSELIAHYCEHLLDELDEDDRYGDPDLRARANPGEISEAELARLHAMVTETLRDRAAFARWFGRHNSAPKYPEVDWQPEQPIDAEEVRGMLQAGAPLCRNPASRFAFIRQGEGAVTLFVDGESFECSGAAAELAEALCAEAEVATDPGLAQSGEVVTLIASLYNQGSLAFAIED
jgi:50S ribosomal protein L16 3-hydroxylase